MASQLILELASPPAPTLDNYIPGRNGAAVAALRAAATGPGPHGPIYLWGTPGSGRSHLVAAAVHAASVSGRTALSVSPEQVPDEAHADLVALDDVDLLDAAAQIRAFDLFNATRARGAAFVAAGREPPSRLPLRADLCTRLASGLAFELTPLEESDKQAALRNHAAARGVALPDEVIAYLLRHLRRDLGTLLAVLDALDRHALAHKRTLTLPFVRTALEALALR